MATPLSLEIYLNKLDRALGSISISEKAEIITDTKRNVMDTLTKNPSQSVDSVLSSMGRPEALANRLLLERGLKPQQPPKNPIVKWLAIGFLGVVGFLCVTTLIIIWKFSPVIEINNGQLKILGGLVNIKDDVGWDMPDDFSISANIHEHGDEGFFQNAIAGTHNVVEKKITGVQLTYHDAAVRIEAAEGNELDWKCVTAGSQKSNLGVIEGEVFKLNLGITGGAKCKLIVPKNIRVAIKGHNGALTLIQPNFPVVAELYNAKVKIEPNDDLKYLFVLKANNGRIDDFTSFDSPGAIEIKVSIHNGVISKD